MLVKLVPVVAKSAIVETFLDLVKEIALVLSLRCFGYCQVPCGGELLIPETFEVAGGEFLTNPRYLLHLFIELHLHVLIGVFSEDLGRALCEIRPRNRLPLLDILARQFNTSKLAC